MDEDSDSILEQNEFQKPSERRTVKFSDAKVEVEVDSISSASS
jgi:hypothetical protein